MINIFLNIPVSVIAVCVMIFVQSLDDSLRRRIYGVYTDIYTDVYYDHYNDINPSNPVGGSTFSLTLSLPSLCICILMWKMVAACSVCLCVDSGVTSF